MRKKISNAAHAVYYGIHYQKSLSRNQIENCYYSMCTLKKSIFLYATVSRIVSVTDIIHLLSVIWHTTSHRWAVPRYFFGTSAGTVGTFVVPVPVPPKNSKVPRYRTGTLVFLFFSTDFKNVPLKT